MKSVDESNGGKCFYNSMLLQTFKDDKQSIKMGSSKTVNCHEWLISHRMVTSRISPSVLVDSQEEFAYLVEEMVVPPFHPVLHAVNVHRL